MMLSLCVKLSRGPLTPVVKTSVVKSSFFRPSTPNVIIRSFADDTRNAFGRVSRRRSLKEMAMAPAGETAFDVGKGALAGGAALGLGALCFYGLGLSNETGAVDRAIMWPEHVRQRIKDTYFYFGSSLVLTAVTAAAAFRSPTLMHFMTKNSLLSVAVSFGAMMGTGMIAQSIPYEKGLGLKQLAWMTHTAVLGAIVAPVCLIGGPLIMRAAWYTAGVVGGLSAIAVCAPSERFLNIGGPLAIGFGVVLASSLGSMFLPPTTVLGAGLYSISMYGGLLLFSGFLLYDTQRIIKAAELYPVYAQRPYDPVNAAISIYLDTINIFIRIAMILASGGNRKK